MPVAHFLLLLASTFALAGCSLIDEASVRPKAGAVNSGWNEARNNGILLNIARAGSEEPLNFVAFSKYTGTASAKSSFSLQAMIPAKMASSNTTYGPFSLEGDSGNTLDLADLDTAEFFGAMSTPVTLAELDSLMRANGVDREILYHLAIDRFRVTLANGEQYSVLNDPSDDHWTGDAAVAGSDANACERIAATEDIYAPVNPSDFSPPFGSGLWFGRHLNDCKFQKFRLFVHLALRSGLRLEPIDSPNPAFRQGVKDAQRLLSDSQFCYDPGLAKDFNVLGKEDDPSRCGQNRPVAVGTFIFAGKSGQIVRIKGVEPVIRSPIGIFRYLGRMLQPVSAARVRLLTRTSFGSPRQLLELSESETYCFSQAWHNGRRYCVPVQNASATKAAFAILATLIALHTKKSDLPPPSTILLAP